MNSQTSNPKIALGISASLHALIAIILVIATYTNRQQAEVATRTFRLLTETEAKYEISPSDQSIKAPLANAFVPNMHLTEATVEKALLDKFASEQQTFTKTEVPKIAQSHISYDEFIKRKGVPQSTKSREPQFSSQNIQKIYVPAREVSAQASPSEGRINADALSSDDQNLLDTYFAHLKEKLRNAHEQPPGITGNFETTVAFYISSNGAISQVRIIRSSGQPIFDSSVLAAFRTLTTLGQRPDNKSDNRTVIFRSRGDE